MSSDSGSQNSRAASNQSAGRLKEGLKLLALGLLLIAPGFLQASTLSQAEVGPSVAGHVQFLIGRAWVEHHDGRVKELAVNDPVGPADVIRTSSGGHVHLRFVDNAFVVVKPSSELEIQQYRYDPEKPAESMIKLNLREGVSRALSGEAARQAKDRFRLNTPIAAIGVRGTDFTVNASRQAVRAKVFEGAIVIAPFSGGCSAEAYGPCIDNARELASSNTEFVELLAEAPVPEIKRLATVPAAQVAETAPASEGAQGSEAAPIVVASADTSATPSPSSSSATAAESDSGIDIYTDSVTTLAVNSKLDETANNSSEPVTPEPQPPVDPEPPVIPEPPAQIVEFTPDQALTLAELSTDTQLLWGRWQERNLDEQRITVDFESALAFGEDIIGGGGYALYRTMPANQGVIRPGIGTLSFGLDKAQAILNAGGAREPVDVLGGSLSINFDERHFDTSLDLFHPATGNYQFTDSGFTFSDGRFLHRTEEQVTVGATTLDGSEAGYFFERQLDAGLIQGITLWQGLP